MSTQYSVAALTYTGEQVGHPDVSTGSGIDIAATAAVGSTPTMSTLAAALQGSPGFYTRELLKDSDIVCVNLGPAFGVLSFYRDYQQSRFWAAYSVRSEAVTSGGTTTQRLRFTSKTDSRLTTLQDALLSVGYPISGLVDSYELGTDITNLNTALVNAKVYMAVWRKP
jgi:hypothetical protein